MYSKLAKYEMKAVSRWLLPFYIAIIVMSILTKCITSIEALHSNVPIFTNIVTVLYYISLVLLIALSWLIVIYRFYQNLLTGEGYLMFTLPVKTKDLILSKFAIAFFWTVISLASSLVSLYFVSKKTITFNSDIFDIKATSLYTFINKFGTLKFTYLILIFLSFIALQLLFIYLCIALGQMFSGNKILGAVISYVVIYNAFQMVAVVIILIVGQFVENPKNIVNYFHILMPIAIVLLLILAYVCYRITRYLLKNKLNLE